MRGIQYWCRLGVAAVALAFGMGAFSQIPGESWQRIGLLGGNITAVAVSPNYDSDTTVFAAVAGAGLWRSNDRGVSWTHVEGVPNNANITALFTDPGYEFRNGRPIYAGTVMGLVYMSDSDFDGYVFRRVLTNQGRLAGVTSGCLRGDKELFWGTNEGIYFSSNYGNSYQNLSVEITATRDCRAIDADPVSGKVLAACYIDKNGPVWEWGGGTTWMNRGPSSLVGVVPTAIHISASKPDYCFLGTADRGMWVSGDKGGTWGPGCDASEQTVPFSVGAVAACPNLGNDGEVWEGRSDGLRTSTDAGASCGWGGLFGSVTGIGFNPTYHLAGMKYCDVFVATTAGLFLRSCDPPKQPVAAPPAVAVSQVALARVGPAGTWAGSSMGLLRNTRDLFFLQYNASGAFNNRNPEITAICLPVAYKPVSNSCGTDVQTAVIAERTLGVFRTRDNGATWAKLDLNSQGVPTWPAGAVVNDLAMAPNYLTGSTDREILFAATSQGLFRWEGNASGGGWVRANEAFNYNITRVALPATYDKRSGTAYPYHFVVLAAQGAIDPKTGLSVGLWYSSNDGARLDPFVNAKEQDITSIGFAPEYATTGPKQIFYASPSKGVYFTDGIETNSPFCAFNLGLNDMVRDLDVSPVLSAAKGAIRLVAATAGGPYFCDFDPGNPSGDCSKVNYDWFRSGWDGGPSQCLDTLCAAFANPAGDGRNVALGTSQDGVFFSDDEGQTFRLAGYGYGSLPDDVYNVLPHRRDDRIVFAASPTYGVFVSRDKGASFRPWNAGSGVNGTSPCVVGSGVGLGMMPDRMTVGGDVVWVGTNGSGIKYRPITYSVAAGIQLDGDRWYDTSQTTGRFERFETLGWGQASKARATSPTLGFFFTAANDWFTWTAENGTLPAIDAKSVRYGYSGADPVPLTSGQTTSGSVNQSAWKYYTFQVPPGTNDLRFFLDDPDDFGSNDPDMYIKFGTPPTAGSWDYRPYTNGDETVCVLPTAFTLLNENFEGTWGPNGDVPPAGWLIYDFGDETVKAWNNNDWHKFAKGGAYGNVARAYYFPLENQNELLMSPAFDIPAGALSANLEFDHYLLQYGAPPQYGRVWYASNQRGWTKIAEFGANTANMAHETLSLLAYRGDTGARVMFQYTGYNGWYWEVDNVKVSGTALSVGTWWVGVNGYSVGASAYELTATLNSGCTGFAAPVAGEGKDLKAAEKALSLYSLPQPDAPSAGVSWGTVSRSGSGGVYVGVDSTPLAGLAGEPAPAAITWEARNGSGAGALTNLFAQCVLQLSDLTLVAGCNGGVFYSPAPDEGRTTWVESTTNVAGSCSKNFTDILECVNRDLLIAANGTTTGGVWLSGDKGRHWMKISEGFDSANQQLEDLVSDTGSFDDTAYYAGTDSTGAYTRTITASPYPTVTALSSTSGSASGGGTITVTGTGFSNTCPTGNSADCPNLGPTVVFGETEATLTTYVSPTTLTCTVPPHATGSVVVTVRNPDTRQGGARTYTYTCSAPSSLSAPTVVDNDSYADTGVTIEWGANPGNWGDGGSGTRTYDVYRDAVEVAKNLPYGTTSYVDNAGTNGVSYLYKVRYRNGCGLTADTATTAGMDQFLKPLEVPNTSFLWSGGTKTTLSWSAATGATGYRVYRGDSSTLKDLPTNAKVCLGYEGAATTTGAIIGANPAAGTFYWYLVVGTNGAGEGSAGPSCVLSSTGSCSPP